MGSVELVRGNITQLNNTVTLAPALGSSAMCLRTNMQCTEQSQCCSGWCLTDMTDHGVVGLCQERLMGSVELVRGNITQLNNTVAMVSGGSHVYTRASMGGVTPSQMENSETTLSSLGCPSYCSYCPQCCSDPNEAKEVCCGGVYFCN